MIENEKILARIAVSKSICKEYNNSNYERTVYLQNGDEFQIQLFNPYTYAICCNINIDNKYIGNDIVLRPGERLWLERYIDVPNKFKFSTYTVDGSTDEKIVKEAISKNGLIEIKFYKEKEKVQINNLIYYSPDSYKLYNNDIFYNYNYDNATNLTCKTFGFAPESTSPVNNCFNSTITSANTSDLKYTCDANIEFNICASSANSSNKARSLSKSFKEEKKIETGRVEKGGYSDQKFVNVDYNFESWPFKTERLHILPLSQKKVNKNDLEKVYCPECGRKLKPKYKFCPYCGAEIE